MRERILISGSSGFLGSRFRQHISQERKVRRLERKELDNPREPIIAFNPDVIIHLATYGNYYFQKDIKETYQVNVMKLLGLLEASNEVDYKAFINVGTSSEYGRKYTPMKEDDPLDPETFYAASKAAGTFLAKAWAIQHDKPIITVRPFSITGVGEQEHHLIPTLIRSCLKGEKMPFVPSPVHDFIDVEDVIDGILLLIEHADKYKGKVFNIGSGTQYSNQKVREIVEEITGEEANIEVVDEVLRDYDTAHKWVADTSKLRFLYRPTLRSLRWQPKKDLEQSIKEMVEYARKNT